MIAYIKQPYRDDYSSLEDKKLLKEPIGMFMADIRAEGHK